MWQRNVEERLQGQDSEHHQLQKVHAILCRTPQELYTALANDLETEIQVSLGID